MIEELVHEKIRKNMGKTGWYISDPRMALAASLLQGDSKIIKVRFSQNEYVYEIFQLVFWEIDDFIYSFWHNLTFSQKTCLVH
jgi:hypothetical protein